MGEAEVSPDLRIYAPDPVWARYGRIERRRRQLWWVLGCTLGVLAAVFAVLAVSQLREAHLYRQGSGEGLKFFWVGVSLAAAWIFALSGAGALVHVALSDVVRTRRSPLLAAGLVMAIVIVSTVLTGWVEGHRDDCIGAC